MTFTSPTEWANVTSVNVLTSLPTIAPFRLPNCGTALRRALADDGHSGRQPKLLCIVGKPAIIPGENTVAFYVGQPLVDAEENPIPGTYVFKYTLHGTLNDGAPTGKHVDLSATSPKITATG